MPIELRPEDGPLIPEEVRNLIAEHITSVEQLEILLLLRADRDRGWTAEKINDRIRSSLSSVNDRLTDLESRGFLRRDGAGFRYDPGPVLEPNVDALTAAYIEFRFSVIELIFKKPTDKTQVFARAFRIRKDEDG